MWNSLGISVIQRKQLSCGIFMQGQYAVGIIPKRWQKQPVSTGHFQIGWRWHLKNILIPELQAIYLLVILTHKVSFILSDLSYTQIRRFSISPSPQELHVVGWSIYFKWIANRSKFYSPLLYRTLVNTSTFNII